MSKLFTARKFSGKEKAALLRQLAFLLRGASNVSDALRILAATLHPGPLRMALQNAAESAASGTTLAAALGRQNAGFTDFELYSVQLGETTGTLSSSLEKLSETIQKQLRIREKTLSACAYPLVVAGAALLMSAFILFYIVPKIVPVFRSMRIKLPFMTRLLLSATGAISGHPWLWLSLLALAAAGFYILAKKFPGLRARLAAAALKSPFVRSTFHYFALSRFCRGMATLLEHHGTLADSLRSASQGMPAAYRQIAERAAVRIEEGATLSHSLQTDSPLFPEFFLSLLEIAEACAALPETFSYAAEYYDRELENRLTQLSSALEPLLMIFLGLFVGGVAIAVLSPLYELVGTMHG